ncbi:MAG TPA: TonB-dependent receptor, partial [Saprospiraceae bacterium]|nr:TonB-dependent receptor [Saprospiraceae bacterium]
KVFNTSGAQTIEYETDLRFYKYYSFLQYKRKFLSDRWSISLGVRNDGNSYSGDMRNPLLQTSPRAAISYQLNEGFQLNATSGLYYQMPAYTILGYRENEVLTNRENKIQYIQCLQHAIGFNYDTKFNSRFSMEWYLKRYAHYPLLLRDSITLANLGGDFGVIGAEPAIPFARGISYGMEWMYQQKLYKGFYGIISYTFGKSEFEDKDKNLVASSWDSRHILNLSLGKQFRKSWEAGINWRFQSGLPYTPFSADSDLRQNWDVNGRGIPDYERLNSLRNEGISQLDIRIDKKWFFKKWNLELYLDVENVTGSSVSSETLILDRPLDADNRPIGGGILVNPNDPLEQQRYKLKSIADATGNALPSIGITLEW